MLREAQLLDEEERFEGILVDSFQEMATLGFKEKLEEVGMSTFDSPKSVSFSVDMWYDIHARHFMQGVKAPIMFVDL